MLHWSTLPLLQISTCTRTPAIIPVLETTHFFAFLWHYSFVLFSAVYKKLWQLKSQCIFIIEAHDQWSMSVTVLYFTIDSFVVVVRSFLCHNHVKNLWMTLRETAGMDQRWRECSRCLSTVKTLQLYSVAFAAVESRVDKTKTFKVSYSEFVGISWEKWMGSEKRTLHRTQGKYIVYLSFFDKYCV